MSETEIDRPQLERHRMDVRVGKRIMPATDPAGPRVALTHILDRLIEEAIERDSASLLLLANLLEDHVSERAPRHRALTRARGKLGVFDPGQWRR